MIRYVRLGCGALIAVAEPYKPLGTREPGR